MSVPHGEPMLFLNTKLLKLKLKDEPYLITSSIKLVEDKLTCEVKLTYEALKEMRNA